MQVRVTSAQLRCLLQFGDLDDASRAGASEHLPAELVSRHRWLVDHGCQPPVAAARNGCCAECNLRLPVQLAIKLRRHPLLATCPSCQRLIYDAAHLEGGHPETPRVKNPRPPGSA